MKISTKCYTINSIIITPGAFLGLYVEPIWKGYFFETAEPRLGALESEGIRLRGGSENFENET